MLLYIFRHSVNLLRIQAQFSDNVPSLVRVELHDPWGEMEEISLTDLNLWTMDFPPDMPQVLKIRLRLEGTASDMVNMKLVIKACANGMQINSRLYAFNKIQWMCNFISVIIRL